MLSGLKAAQALRKQGGGDVERQVVVQPSQVRISDRCNLYLTSYSRSKLIMTEGRVGKVRLQFHVRIWWVGVAGL